MTKKNPLKPPFDEKTEHMLRSYFDLSAKNQAKARLYISDLHTLQDAEDAVQRKKRVIQDHSDDDLKYCSLCGKSEIEATALVVCPNDIFICEDCVGILSEAVTLADKENP